MISQLLCKLIVSLVVIGIIYGLLTILKTHKKNLLLQNVRIPKKEHFEKQDSAARNKTNTTNTVSTPAKEIDKEKFQETMTSEEMKGWNDKFNCVDEIYSLEKL